MQFFLQLAVRCVCGVLLNELAASALELLLKSSLEVLELLVLGKEGLTQHVDLALLLRDFFFVELLQSNHCLMDLLDLLILSLYQSVELSLL